MQTQAIDRVAVRAFGIWLALMTPALALAATRTLTIKSGSGLGQDTGTSTWLRATSAGTSNGVAFNQMTTCPQNDSCNSLSFTTSIAMFLFQIPFAPDDLSVTFSGLSVTCTVFDGKSCGDNTYTSGGWYGINPCDAFSPAQTTLALCTPNPSSLVNADVTIPGDNSSLTMTFGPTASSPSSSYFPQGGLTFFIIETFPTGSAIPAAPTVTIVSGHAGAALVPGSLNFGSQKVNTTSALQSVILKNGGLSPFSIWSIAANGDFAESDNCRNSNSLAAGAFCTIFVSFTPTASGSRTGTLTIGDSAPSGPQTVALSGSGDSTQITLSEPTLSFGSQPITGGGTTSSASAPITVTLTNTSSSNSINITGISISADPVVTSSGDFNVESTSTCTNLNSVAHGTPFSGSVNVAALGTCTLDVDAQPLLLGPVSGTVTITDSVGTHVIALTTIGATPMLTLSCCSGNPPLAFTTQNDGTSSSPTPISVGNGSPKPAVIDGLLAGGGLSSDGTTTCAPSGNLPCNLNIDFSPIFPGAQTNQFVFTDSISTGIEVITSTGTGLGPLVSVSTPSLSYSPQTVGTTSSPMSATLFNNGNHPLTISSVGINGGNSGDFQIQSNACPLSPSTLAASSSCTVSATFSPSAPGPRKSSLVFTDNAPGSPHSTALAGLGIDVTLSPPTLTFPGQTTGTSSTPQSVALANSSNLTLHIWEITFLGTNASDYSKTTTCGSTLAGNASCTINVTFMPGGVGTRTASLMVSDDGAGGLQAAGLTGTGLAGPVSGGATTTNASSATGTSVAWVGVTESSIQFGIHPVGSKSPIRLVAIKNTSSTAFKIQSVVISGENALDFTQTNNCGSALPAGTSCTLRLAFTPRADGRRAATLTLIGNPPGGAGQFRLNGFGVLRSRASLPHPGQLRTESLHDP